MAEYQVMRGARPGPPRGKAPPLKYPWPQMTASDEAFFDVPLGSDDTPRAVMRRVLASGRSWCKRHAASRKAVVRLVNDHSERGRAVRAWLVRND